jgi:hypothetical protein
LPPSVVYDFRAEFNELWEYFRKNRAAKLLWTKIPAIETNKAGPYRIMFS